MTYRYTDHDTLDAYGDTQNVIHLKFGDMRKHYHLTDQFADEHPNFAREYDRYFNHDERSLFMDPLQILNYIDTFKLPIHLYSNFVDQEFADVQAARDYLAVEYQGKNGDKLYRASFDDGYQVLGLDNEIRPR